MRTMIIVLCLFIAQTLSAQNDTLYLQIEDYGQIRIVTKQLVTDKNFFLDYNKDYSEFYEQFKKTKNFGITDSTAIIRYIYSEKGDFVNNIRIEKNNNLIYSFYMPHDTTLILKSYNYKLIMNNSNFIVQVNKLSDFEKIAQLNIDSIYESAAKELVKMGAVKRISFKVLCKIDQNQLISEPIRLRKEKSYDYISIYSTTGVSIINSNFAPEININLDLLFSYKTKPKYSFGLNTTFLFIPDKNYFFKIYTYNIANAYYSYRIKDNSAYKLSIGYMYRKTGAHFNGDTWLASWQYNRKNIGLKFTGYFTHNENGKSVVIPSVGVNFNF